MKYITVVKGTEIKIVTENDLQVKFEVGDKYMEKGWRGCMRGTYAKYANYDNHVALAKLLNMEMEQEDVYNNIIPVFIPEKIREHAKEMLTRVPR